MLQSRRGGTPDLTCAGAPCRYQASPVCSNGHRFDVVGRPIGGLLEDGHTISAVMFGTLNGLAILRGDHRCGSLLVPAWATLLLQSRTGLRRTHHSPSTSAQLFGLLPWRSRDGLIS